MHATINTGAGCRNIFSPITDKYRRILIESKEKVCANTLPLDIEIFLYFYFIIQPI